jgi:predicted SAM-dependent methyltransferase
MSEEVKFVRVDLGCGSSCRVDDKGKFIGVDIAQCDGVDIVHDLTVTPWPFKDNSIDEVFCSHFVEHLSGEQLIRFMEELYRVTKPGSIITILAPYYSSMRATQDPTHKSFISEASFLYYNKVWREQNKLEHYDINCDFNYSYAYHMDPYWAMRNEEARSFAVRHYINVVNDIQVNMVRI